MLAYANGKKVEWSFRDEKSWEETNCPNFNWGSKNYRIKPEPKYRPFKDAEECWQEMRKHRPFGWIKSDDPNMGFVQINQVEENQRNDGELLIWYAGSSKDTAEEIFKLLTFVDGEPFGVKEEA